MRDKISGRSVWEVLLVHFYCMFCMNVPKRIDFSMKHLGIRPDCYTTGSRRGSEISLICATCPTFKAGIVRMQLEYPQFYQFEVLFLRSLPTSSISSWQRKDCTSTMQNSALTMHSSNGRFNYLTLYKFPCDMTFFSFKLTYKFRSGYLSLRRLSKAQNPVPDALLELHCGVHARISSFSRFDMNLSRKYMCSSGEVVGLWETAQCFKKLLENGLLMAV